MVPYLFVTCWRTKSNQSRSLESITTVYIHFDTHSDPQLVVNNVQYFLLTVEHLHVLKEGPGPLVKKLGGLGPPVPTPLPSGHEFTRGENMKPPSRSLLCEWVKASWAAVSVDMVKGSFLSCAITSSLDGKQDCQIHCFKPGQPCAAGRELLAEET